MVRGGKYNMKISKDEVKYLMKKAFECGEQWGVTYSTWFTPTKEQTVEQLNELFRYYKLIEK
jgi:hypothetical protein